MDTNSHFAEVGSANDKAAYEHGVQVIDENKEFKYVCFHFSYYSCHWRTIWVISMRAVYRMYSSLVFFDLLCVYS